MDYATQIQMTVRSLKGCPLSVFVLMLWSRNWHSPVWTVDELKTGTGYKHGTAVADARSTLIGLGLCEAAERGRIGLRLVDRAVQQLGLWDTLPPVGNVIEGEPSEIRFSNLTGPTTTTALLTSFSSANAVVAEAESDIRKTNLTRPTTSSPAIDAKLAAALKAAGIGSNAWPGLAKLEHVTPAYVKAHDAYRRGRGESTGMLITRLRCGDPVPKKEIKRERDVAAAWQKDIDERRGGKRRKG